MLSYQVERSFAFEEITPIFKCLKNMRWNQYWSNDTNTSLVGKSVLKLMNYVFYLILKSPNSYLWESREIYYDSTHISMYGSCLCKLLIRWYMQGTLYLIIINKTILYGKHFNKNSQSHSKVKVPLPHLFTPIVPLPTSCVPPPHIARIFQHEF